MTNQPPKDAKLRSELMALQAPDPLDLAHKANPQIPPPLGFVLARAMAVDRERRYPTAAAMREALRQTRESIKETLLEQERQKQREQEATRLLAEEQRLAEEARQRAAAEAERKRREETERKQKEEAERKLRVEAERRQKEEAERKRIEQEEAERKLRAEAERKQKEKAERKQREARERALAEQRRQAQEARKQIEPTTAPMPTPAPPGQTRARQMAILGVALFSILLGYGLWNAWRSGEPSGSPSASPAVSPSQPTSTAKPPNRIEVLRYTQKFAADGGFRLRFTPQQSGYLYLVALDERDIPITLLTNRHAYEVSGRSNRLTAGAELVFPLGRPLTLSGNKSSAPFTLIFSRVELKEPGFLNAVRLVGLTSAEQQTLTELKRRAAERAPEIELTTAGETVVTALPSDDKLLVVEIVVRK